MTGVKSLGLGMIGLHHQHPRWYWPLWQHLPEYRPVAMAEADESFLHEEKEWFGLETHADYRALLERPDIDVVIVWLPHREMPRAVAEAAAAGKHVIVEKPCAADVAGGEAIVETARAFPEICIGAPYCWRTHPVSARIVEAVQGGLLGEPQALEGRLNAGGAHRYVRDRAEWMLRAEQGGGPMWNLGVHWIDYFRWITGREIVTVQGVTTAARGVPERDIEDSAQAVLTLDNGATALLDISYGLPEYYPDKRDIYVSMRGSLGAFAWRPNWEGTTNELLVASDAAAAGDRNCRRVEVACQAIPGYCGQMAWQWLKDFAAAVRGERAAPVSVDDMLATLRVADAFYRSVRSRKAETVVVDRKIRRNGQETRCRR